MCDTCGCNITSGNKHLIEAGGKHQHTPSGKEAVTVLHSLLHENDHQASHNREHFDKNHVLAINIMSSPGSGKTTLLEATINQLKSDFNIAVIEGDLETENDAERIRKQGVTAIQIATGSACHLDAHMVHDAVHTLNLNELDIVFIENVGNLVCPASFDLGHHQNVTLLSVTEGDDKPQKYPVMFRGTDLMIISKSDFLDFIDDFDPAKAEHHLRHLANDAPVFTLSAKNQKGFNHWIDWIKQQHQKLLYNIQHGASLHPSIQNDGQHLHTHE
ncbi:MAG: hydrogenase nickel incorporation protein HypB [Gammaproteobacteria bacterium]|nr:hydrogenase nickel incorporation protein HypB [Gammaproteobacteria bacterium]